MTEDAAELQEIITRENEFFRCKLLADPGRLKLFLECEIIPDAPEFNTSAREIAELLSPLLNRAVLYPGILDDIAQRLNKRLSVERRRIAKGTPPRAGKDGRLLLLVKKRGKPADFSEIISKRLAHSFDNVEAGTPVGRIYPPKEGEPGIDVFGQAIAAPSGQPITVDIGDHIAVKQPSAGHRYQTLVAQIAGYLSDEDGPLSIKDTLEVFGDLDYRNGSVDFVGKVSVNGSIREGFSIFARGDIEINGDVCEAALRSSTGSVRISGRVIGRPVRAIGGSGAATPAPRLRLGDEVTTHIRAAGSIRAGGFQDAVAEAGGSIIAVHEIMGSFLYSKNSVIVENGPCIGGEVSTTHGLEAEAIGNAAGAATRVRLLSSVESSVEYMAIVRKIESHQKAEEMMKLYLGPYAENRVAIERLNHTHRAKLAKLLRKLDEVTQSREALEKERKEKLSAAQHKARIPVSFRSAFYPAVEIRAGEAVFVSPEPLKGPASVVFVGGETAFEIGELETVGRLEPESEKGDVK